MSDLTPSPLFDESPVPSFAINQDHVVTHFNRACAQIMGVQAADVIGKKGLGLIFYGHERPVMADLIVDGSITEVIDDLYQNHCRRSSTVPDAYEAEGFFPQLGVDGRWLFFTAAPLRNAQGEITGAIETLQDITQRKLLESALMVAQLEIESTVTKRTAELAQANQALQEDMARRKLAEAALIERNAELHALNTQLSSAQAHLIKSEKLASIGQLAAGVAHEINNPIGYIFSNFGTLEGYLSDLFGMLIAYEAAERTHGHLPTVSSLAEMRQRIELAYLKEDIPMLMAESLEGIVRVRKIVKDLKDFSHVDTSCEWQMADINQGIDSTLNVVNCEIKYKADVLCDYGDLPQVQCMPSQINQVVMNLVVNAAHAIGPERGKITIRTGHDATLAWFEVSDNGSGIPKEVLPRIFDPFYTTKPVGKGTGLGLSLSYGIVQHHNGDIKVQTEAGIGTTFRVSIPLIQSSAPEASPQSD